MSNPIKDNPNRDKVYNYICTYMMNNQGNPPTIRQIRDGIGMPHSSVNHHLGILRRIGKIHQGSNHPVGGLYLPPEVVVPLRVTIKRGLIDRMYADRVRLSTVLWEQIFKQPPGYKKYREVKE